MILKPNYALALSFRTFSIQNVPFLYPDLSEIETKFVQQQTELVLKPKCLESKVEHIFPPNSRKFLYGSVKMVQEDYDGFVIPKNDNARFVRNLTSIPKLERVIGALKSAKVTQSDLFKKPDLILMNPHEIFHQGQVANAAKVRIYDYHTFYNNQRMHGLFVSKYIQQMSGSLKALGFEEAADKIQEIDLALYSPLHFFKMERLLARIMLKELSKHVPDLNLDKLRNQTINVVDLARILYLWKKMDLTTFDVRTLTTLNSYEALIQLNAIFQGLELQDDVSSEILWRTLHFASQKFPLGLQIRFLREIGFDLEEIRQILLPIKSIKLSSKGLPYTHEDYVPKMRDQLATYRQSHPNANAIELMKFLTSSQFELSEPRRIQQNP